MWVTFFLFVICVAPVEDDHYLPIDVPFDTSSPDVMYFRFYFLMSLVPLERRLKNILVIRRLLFVCADGVVLISST